MAKIKKYEQGQSINGVVYLKDDGYYNERSGLKSRVCIFICPVCSKEFSTRLSSIKAGLRSSCGCKKKLAAKNRNITHGMSKSVEYRIWGSMVGRCSSDDPRVAKDYKSKGVTVCDEWVASFEKFFNDMGARPSSGHSIDRVEVTKGYYKENCRWATIKEQNRNTRRTVFAIISGVKRPLMDWIEEYGLQKYSGKIRTRITLRKWEAEKAFNYKIPNPI